MEEENLGFEDQKARGEGVLALGQFPVAGSDSQFAGNIAVQGKYRFRPSVYCG